MHPWIGLDWIGFDWVGLDWVEYWKKLDGFIGLDCGEWMMFCFLCYRGTMQA